MPRVVCDKYWKRKYEQDECQPTLSIDALP